jgi:plastocyanin
MGRFAETDADKTHAKEVDAMKAWLAFGLAALTVTSAAAQTGTITGRVVFKGTPPKPKEVSASAMKAADAKCAALHKGKPLQIAEVQVGPNGGLKWVLVYIKGGVKGNFKPPTKPVIVDQTGCLFVPHAVAVQAGQPVEFRNSDPLLHNIRANSKQGQSFNIAQPVKGMKQVRKFSKPEIGIQLRCDVHWWMAGYLHVLPHPFFAITGDDGTFTIKGVPAGTYRLEAWHEKLGTQTKTVTVKPGETVTVDFTFSAR